MTDGMNTPGQNQVILILLLVILEPRSIDVRNHSGVQGSNKNFFCNNFFKFFNISTKKSSQWLDFFRGDKGIRTPDL